MRRAGLVLMIFQPPPHLRVQVLHHCDALGRRIDLSQECVKSETGVSHVMFLLGQGSTGSRSNVWSREFTPHSMVNEG